MHFKLTYFTRDFLIKRDETLEVQCGDHFEVQVHIKSSLRNGDTAGGNTVCIADFGTEINPETITMFRSLQEKSFLKDIVQPVTKALTKTTLTVMVTYERGPFLAGACFPRN